MSAKCEETFIHKYLGTETEKILKRINEFTCRRFISSSYFIRSSSDDRLRSSISCNSRMLHCPPSSFSDSPCSINVLWWANTFLSRLWASASFLKSNKSFYSNEQDHCKLGQHWGCTLKIWHKKYIWFYSKTGTLICRLQSLRLLYLLVQLNILFYFWL